VTQDVFGDGYSATTCGLHVEYPRFGQEEIQPGIACKLK
jgi:hypothetical protein